MVNNTKSILTAFGLSALLIWLQCSRNSRQMPAKIIATILSDSSSYFYLNAEQYPSDNPALPVGIFDSGTGGLTVLEALLEFDGFDNVTHSQIASGDGIRDFRDEYFIYLGDQANMPYGRYAGEHNTALLKEHIIKDAQFLLGRRYYRKADSPIPETDKSPVKAIVIACNTASAYGKADIETFLRKAEIDMKVIGVIGAGARGALSNFAPDEDGSIGVLATAGTVTSQGYVTALQEVTQQWGYSGELSVYQQAGIGLAGAIDGAREYIDPAAMGIRNNYKGPSLANPEAPIDTAIIVRYGFDWNDYNMLVLGDRHQPDELQLNSVENYINYHLVSLLEQLRNSAAAHPLKVIILGCTHYPFYREQIRSTLKNLYNYREIGVFIYRSYMVEDPVLVDPARNTAVELYEYLRDAHLLNRADLYQSEFYISLPNLSNPHIQLDSLGGFTYEYKYTRSAGEIQEYVKRIPFSRETLTNEITIRLRQKVPFTYELIRHFTHNNPKMEYLSADSRL